MKRKSAAPYLEILAELRGRIERGTLRPGERVPSTRAIVLRWGVAMATATKVLTALRQQGLVRAVPGVGMLVEGRRTPRGRASSSRSRSSSSAAAPEATPAPRRRRATPEPLVRDRIVATATAIADAEGLAALSMRRVAVELDVATMSLYRHVADKDALLLHMMDAAFQEQPFPTTGPDGWRERLELAGRMLWATFRRHPWLASAMSVTRPQLVRSGMAYTEWVLHTLDRLGLDASTILTTHITLFNYIRGTAVNLEAEAEAEAASGVDSEEWMEGQESALEALIAEGRFPVLARLIASSYDFDLEVLFEFGLQRLLDGLAVLVDAPDRRPGAQGRRATTSLRSGR